VNILPPAYSMLSPHFSPSWHAVHNDPLARSKRGVLVRTEG
jgi:hypothetical protein